MKRFLIIFSLVGLAILGSPSFSEKLHFFNKKNGERTKGTTSTGMVEEVFSKKFDFITAGKVSLDRAYRTNTHLSANNTLNLDYKKKIRDRPGKAFSGSNGNTFKSRSHDLIQNSTKNDSAVSSYLEFTRPYGQPTADEANKDEDSEQLRIDEKVTQEESPPLENNQTQATQSDQIFDFGIPEASQSPDFEIIDGPDFSDPEKNFDSQNRADAAPFGAGGSGDISGGETSGMGGFFSFGGTNTQATNQNKEQTSLGNTQNTGQTSPSGPSLPPTNQRVVKISSLSIGYSHFCIISSGSLYCAGTNSSGEIGLPGSISSSSRLTKVSDLDGIVSISNGDQFSCALFDDFTASCFGDNTLNKLSSDEFGNLVDSFGSVIENIAQISAGKDSACLVTNTGDLYCWGKNNAGQLGKPENTEPNSAKKVVTTEKFKRVIVSSEHACAITFNNRLYCWGSNQFGKLGINLSGDRSEPTLVSELEEVLDFALGQNHTCAISKEGASGRLYCWGSNDLGQLLSLEEKTFRKPVLLSTDKFTSIVSTERAICAKGLDNSGSCWGEISFSGDGVYTSELTKYPGMESISELFGSANGVCFTSKSNDLFCLGNNESKQYEQSLSSFITIPKKIAISGLN